VICIIGKTYLLTRFLLLLLSIIYFLVHLQIDIPQSIDKKLQLLRCCYLFRKWPPRHLERLSFFTDIVRAKQKENLFNDGDRANHVFVVLTGLLTCTKIISRTNIKQNKVDLEICGPLSVCGLESTKPGFPCFTSSLSCVHDSNLLKINISEMTHIIESVRKSGTGSHNQEGTPKEGLQAMFDTRVLMTEHHQRRAFFWELRRSFLDTYFDVTVKLTLEVQLRHMQQVCGRCGVMGHVPSNSLRCKGGGLERVSEVLNQLTGIERIINHNVNDDDVEGSLEEAQKKVSRDQERRRKSVHVFPEPKRKSERTTLLQEAAARMLQRQNNIIPVLHVREESTDVPSNYSYMHLHNNHLQRPIWDSLMTPKGKHGLITESAKGKGEIRMAGMGRVGASLNMKFRNDTGKSSLNSMLHNAYPNHKSVHQKMHALKPRCHHCGDRGHHIYSCPYNPNPNIEKKRQLIDMLQTSKMSQSSKSCSSYESYV